MAYIKGIGYVFVAIVLLMGLFFVGGVVITAFLILGVVLAAASVVAFVAFCIKEYCEPEPPDPRKGPERREPQGHP